MEKNKKENPKSVELRNFRMKDNTLGDYDEVKLYTEFACNIFSEKHLVATNLYRDEAVIISRAFQQQKILHTVKEEGGKYEIRISRILIIRKNMLQELIAALQIVIGDITGKAVIIEEGKFNKLIISEDGTLEKITHKNNPKGYLEIMVKLIEYIQDILK